MFSIAFLFAVLALPLASGKSGSEAAITTRSGNICDRIGLGTSFNIMEDADCDFIVMDPLFFSLIDAVNSSLEVLLEDEESIFHEGPVVFNDEQEHALYFVTNRLGNTSPGPTWLAIAPSQPGQYIDMYRVDLETLQMSIVTNSNGEAPIIMGNGMTKSPDGESLLALSQGFNYTGGGVYKVDRQSYEAEPVVEGYFGIPFNSPNDIVSTSDGILFLTDPVYGFEQGFRLGNPELGSNVYRYDMSTMELTLLATNLQRPNGIAVLDERAFGNGCTLFLTDTGYEGSAQKIRGFDGSSDSAVFYMKDDRGCFESTNSPYGTGLTPWIPVIKGIQDGIKVHAPSQLLFYCDGVGVWIWSIPMHKPLGIIPMENGCTQLVLDPVDAKNDVGVQDLYVLSENQLSIVQLDLNPYSW